MLFDGATILGNDVTANLANSGVVSFTGTVNGVASGADLTITSAGNSGTALFFDDVILGEGTPQMTLLTDTLIADDLVWQMDNLTTGGSTAQILAANTALELAIYRKTFDGADITIGGSDPLMGGPVVDSLKSFSANLSIGASILAADAATKELNLPGNIIVADSLGDPPASINLVSIGDIRFEDGGLLTADAIRLAAFGNDGTLVGLPAGTVANEGGFVFDDSAGGLPPGFIDAGAASSW